MAKKKKAAMAQEIVDAVVYLRVSTEEQAASGLSLEAQETRCRAYCAAQGWAVVAVLVDTQTAKHLDRPRLQEALKALQPGRALVVLKLDRLTRRVSHIEPLMETIGNAGGNLVSVSEHLDTSTATGRLMLRLIVEVSQWEREIIGERTAAALAQKKVRGERLGTIPLGYRKDDNGDLVADELELATVARARALRSEGLTLRTIAKTLTDEGHWTKRGGAWGAETVRKILATRYLENIET